MTPLNRFELAACAILLRSDATRAQAEAETGPLLEKGQALLEFAAAARHLADLANALSILS